MRARVWFQSAFRAMTQDRRGIAAVEFALIAPVAIAILLGVYDIGTVVHEQHRMQQALRAGGLYALSFPTQTGAMGTPNDGIVSAIQLALPPGWTDVIPPKPEINSRPPYFIRLTVSRPYTPLWPLFWPKGFTDNAASYTIRVQ